MRWVPPENQGGRGGEADPKRNETPSPSIDPTIMYEGGRWEDVDLVLRREGASALTGPGFEASSELVPFLRSDCRCAHLPSTITHTHTHTNVRTNDPVGRPD